MAGQRRPMGWMIMETTNANRSCMRYTNGRHGLLSGGKPFGHIQAAREKWIRLRECPEVPEPDTGSPLNTAGENHV